MKIDFCPGAGNIKGTPTLKVKRCPECGKEVEVFSTDMQVECPCGFIVYNDVQSCVKWCKAARECVGEEMYRQLAGESTNPAVIAERKMEE